MYLYTQNSLIYRVLYIHSFIQLWIKVYVCRLVLFMAYLLKNNYKIGCQKMSSYYKRYIAAIKWRQNLHKIDSQHHATPCIGQLFCYQFIISFQHSLNHDPPSQTWTISSPSHNFMFLYNACHHEAFFCIWLLYSTRLQSECITI